MILKQSTAATVVVGPVLDSAGAAVTTAVAANFSLSKNGTINALTSETVTHSTNGYYTIALTSSNTDTLGRVEVIVNDSAMSMATHRYNVIVGTSYDLLVTSGGYSTLDAAGIRTAVGLASANLDTQLSTIDTVVDNIEADTQDIQSRLPAELVDGRLVVLVDAMSNNTITAAAIATDAADEIADRVASLDILTSPYGTNTWGRVARDTYTGLATVDVIVNAILADTADMQPKVATAAEIADAVYDEPYAGHTTPGTYGFLWDKWRKSNPTITGEVTAAITPTTTTFSTDITGYPDTAFDNAVLVFINGSTNADFRGVVSGYLQANGQVTITPALPQAPVAGDEFVIAITSFVYTTTQTQNGLATSAEVAAIDAVTDKLDTTLELDGAVYRFTTNALEQAPTGGGGGGTGSFTVTLTIKDNTGVVVPECDVSLTTSNTGSTSGLVAAGRTNANGVVSFQLDAGTYYGWRQKSGFRFTNPFTMVVADDGGVAIS